MAGPVPRAFIVVQRWACNELPRLAHDEIGACEEVPFLAAFACSIPSSKILLTGW
jgi:hypothetical protein